MDNIEKTLKKIEKLEKTWRYELTDEEDESHSYGRIPEDGKTIAFWSIPRTTGLFLESIAFSIKAKKILELGCSAGYSTIYLARALEKTDGIIYTTEIHKKKIQLAKKHFKESGLEHRIVLFEEEIKSVLSNWEISNNLDLIFMDADKENYSKYLDQIKPILKYGGLIIVDNAGKIRMPDNTLIDNKYIDKFITKVNSDKDLTNYFLKIDNGLLLIKYK